MAEELDQPEGPLPAAAEQIHLPDPSYLPPVMALGIALMITGLVLSIFIVALGAILFLVTLVKWIRLTREEMSELPVER